MTLSLNVAGALDVFGDVEVGKQVLVDDGKLGLRVVTEMLKNVNSSLM